MHPFKSRTFCSEPEQEVSLQYICLSLLPLAPPKPRMNFRNDRRNLTIVRSSPPPLLFELTRSFNVDELDVFLLVMGKIILVSHGEGEGRFRLVKCEKNADSHAATDSPRVTFNGMLE
jgi:hypothetical protein